MRIEVELLKIDQDTDKARACAVALLSALPQDEAHLAIAEWEAVCKVRQADADGDGPWTGRGSARTATAMSVELKEGFAAAKAEIAALQEASAAPPQDAGYSPPPVHFDGEKDKLDSDMNIATTRDTQSYQVGGWVVTDLGEMAKVAATRVGKDGAYLTVEVDEGEEIPFDKLIHVKRVRPATTAEVTAGAARETMAPPAQDAGAKKKGGRLKKVTTQPEPDGSAAETATAEVTTQPQDGKAEKYEATSLKDLCKLAEHHATRQKLFDLFKEHGVDKLGADAAKDTSLRTAVLELVP